jgi:hypothetical protein
MPVCLTITHTRPNTGVEFYKSSEEFRDYQYTAYRRCFRNHNGPYKSQGDNSQVEIWHDGWYPHNERYWLSNNDLTVTNRIYFVDRATYTRWSEDSQIAALLSVPWDAYNEDNNITRTLEVEEVDSVPDIPPE